MYDALKYILLFVLTLLLQLFFFNALQLGPYVTPLVYIAFIVLLPMKMPPLYVLLSGLLMGVLMDIGMGTAGLNTIATLLTAYARIWILNLIVGKEYVSEGGIPGIASIGRKKFLRYAGIMTLLQCAVFFPFETMNGNLFLHTLLRIIASWAITLLFVWLIALVFTHNNIRSQN